MLWARPNADRADGFIGHPIESRLHLRFVTDKTKSWVCNNDPWSLLDSWPSASESGSFQTPEIFRPWVQNPLRPPMQFVLRPNAEPHTRSAVWTNICVCSPWRAVSVYVEWGGTCVTASCLAAASVGGSGVLFCNGFSRRNKEWEGDAEGERGEGREERD